MEILPAFIAVFPELATVRSTYRMSLDVTQRGRRRPSLFTPQGFDEVAACRKILRSRYPWGGFHVVRTKRTLGPFDEHQKLALNRQAVIFRRRHAIEKREIGIGGSH